MLAEEPLNRGFCKLSSVVSSAGYIDLYRPILLICAAINQWFNPSISGAPAIVGAKNKVSVALHVFNPKTDGADGKTKRAVETAAIQIIGAKAVANQIFERR
mgnify:CR=1 FL=1